MKKITKSLMTLLLLAVGGVNANAQDVTYELVHETDWSTKTSYGYWGDGIPATATISVEDGLLTVVNSQATSQNYEVQYFGDDNIALEAGEDYVVKITAKSNVDGNVVVGLGGWGNSQWSSFDITANEELAEFSININSFPDDGGAHVMLQTGFMVGTVQFGKVSVYKAVKSSGGEEPDVDPGVIDTPEGYIGLVNNGTLADTDVSSFFIKLAYGDDKGKTVPATITADAGRAEGAGLKFTSSADESLAGWDTQFWVVFNKQLDLGTTYHIEFDYKASETASASTQQQGAECNYLNNNDVPFTITASNKWKHFSKDLTTTCTMQSLAFNLNENKGKAIDFFFDNFVVYTEDVPEEVQEEDTEDPGVKAVPEGWMSLISNGDLEDEGTSNFKTKDENGPNGVGDDIEITSDAGRMKGNGLKVVSKDGATNAWGTQFFIVSDQWLKEGQKLHIEFDYRADRKATVPVQAHREPGNYNSELHNEKVNFTVNWQHYENEITLSSDETKNGGMLSVGFNLNEDRNTNNFYFDNIVLWTEDLVSTAKAQLELAIANGEAQSDYLKTSETWGALQTAISEGQGLLEGEATADEFDAATKNITDAIDGLEYEEGYTKLTKEMYTNPGACAYVLGASTGQPYGDGSVYYENYANLSDYSTLILRVTAGTPRVMLNRAEPLEEGADGYDKNGGAYVQLTPAPEDNIVVIDLTQYGFVHLNAIKGANWQEVTITDMILSNDAVASTVPVTIDGAGYATFYSEEAVELADDMEAFGAVYDEENGSVKLYPVEGTVLAAETPVILKASANNYELAISKENGAEPEDNDLEVSDGSISGSNIYVLAETEKSELGVGFCLLDASVQVPENKCYLVISAVGAREFIPFAGDATTIKAIETLKKSGIIYNLAGQKVKNAKKGVFVIDGKKVMK